MKLNESIYCDFLDIISFIFISIIGINIIIIVIFTAVLYTMPSR